MASRSWNRVELIGNLTRDPELRYTPSGAAVCTFGLATNRTYVSEGEKKEEVDFHRLVAWNKLAELCNQLLKKGNKAFISGRLQTRSWEGQDGQSRTVTEIVIEDMIVLTPRTNGDYQPPEGLNVAQLPKEKPEKAEISDKNEVKDKKASVVKEEKSEVSEEESDSTNKKTPPQEEVKDDGDLPF